MPREDVVVCAPAHELAKRKRITLKDLEKYPLLLLDRGSNTRTFIDQQFSKAGVNPDINMELGSIEVIKRLVQLNFGISIVPFISLKREIEQGTLKAIRLLRKSECRMLGVIYPKNGIHSLPAQVFVQMLKKNLLVIIHILGRHIPLCHWLRRDRWVCPYNSQG